MLPDDDKHSEKSKTSPAGWTEHEKEYDDVHDPAAALQANNAAANEFAAPAVAAAAAPAAAEGEGEPEAGSGATGMVDLDESEDDGPTYRCSSEPPPPVYRSTEEPTYRSFEPPLPVLRPLDFELEVA